MSVLQYRIESAIPSEFVVGDGNVLVICGWVLPPRPSTIAGFSVSLDDRRCELPHTRDVRLDLLRDSSIAAPNEDKLVSGFWLPVAAAGELAGRTCRLTVSLRLEDGELHPLIDQDISLRARLPNLLNGQLAKLPPASLAVCMATSDPDPACFARQIASLVAQTHRDWFCLVQDGGSRPEILARLEEICGSDPRIALVRSAERLDPDRALERCLGNVPPGVETVALFGGGDEWPPNRLADALARLRPGVALVRAQGTDRGGDAAICVLRNATLQRALPFPEPARDANHHDWLAKVAALLGETEELDGAREEHAVAAGDLRNVVAAARRTAALARPPQLRGSLFAVLERYYRRYRPLALQQQILALRFDDPEATRRASAGPTLDASVLAHNVLHPMLPRALTTYNHAKYARQNLRGAVDRAKGFARRENPLRNALSYWRQQGSAMFVKKLAHVAAHGVGERLLRMPDPSPPATGETDRANELVRDHFVGVTTLPTYSSPRNAPRINLVTDSINAGSLYGGVGTALIFAALLAERRGADLRIITRTERADAQNFATLMRVAKIDTLQNVEFHFADIRNPKVDVDVDSRELFVTTSWWTTQSTRRAIAPSRIIYVLQEDERMFYPFGDDHLRCSEALSSPDGHLVVNSELLAEHFAQSGLAEVARRCHRFEPSFPRELFHAEPRAPQGKRRFFFYARPHNQRNVFHRGIEAIGEAVARGVLDPARWELHFVGNRIPRLQLPHDIQPHVHENLDWFSYAALVRSIDLGLSLMYTPHPSYPPLDLAASGAVVVTNRFGNKQSLDRYSRNILCVEPTRDALVDGIAAGVRLADDHAARSANYEASGMGRDWRASFAGALDALATLP